jgi:molybdopterin biosynthesis enzyme
VARIDQLVAPVEPRRIKLGEAAGMCLAEDIAVRYAHPGSAIALRDGIAIGSDATLDASSYAPVRLAGAPTFVDVGDTLPPHADAVASLDSAEIRQDGVDILAPFAPGDGVLPPEADATAGDVLGRAGARLRASDVTILSLLGVSEVDVRVPRICIVRAKPGRDAVIGAIESLLLRVVEAAGGSIVMSSHIRLSFEDAVTAASAVIVIGGSGSGRRDRSVHELARLGSVTFHGVGLAPGETAAFGVAKKRPVLIVPARLDAALAVWLTLGRRMLARLSGHDDEEQSTPVTLTRKIASTLGFAELVPVAREGDGVTPLASGYLSLQSLVRADGYVLVPADSEGFPAGARVEMRPLP